MLEGLENFDEILRQGYGIISRGHLGKDLPPEKVALIFDVKKNHITNS